MHVWYIKLQAEGNDSQIDPYKTVQNVRRLSFFFTIYYLLLDLDTSNIIIYLIPTALSDEA